MRHSSGTTSIPALTTRNLMCQVSGGTTQATGDLTITSELEVTSGATFNGQNYTHPIEYIDNKGAIALNGGTFTINGRIDGDTTSSWDLQSCTIQGVGTGHRFRVSHDSDCELVGGTFKGFEVQNHGYGLGGGGGITVIGEVISSSSKAGQTHPNHLIQWHHTLDTQQLLDADSAGDDDLRLTKPALDNAHELMTG